jgi:hypothetical protein
MLTTVCIFKACCSIATVFSGFVVVASDILVTKLAVGAVFVNVVTAYMVLAAVIIAKVTTATVMTLWWL